MQKYYLLWFQNVLIWLTTLNGFDFIVQNVEAGNFDKILRIKTFLQIFSQGYIWMTIMSLKRIQFGYKLVRMVIGLYNFVILS